MSFSDRSFMKFFYIVMASLIGLAVLAIVLANMLGGASREEAQYFRDLKDDTLLATAGNTVPLNDVVVASAGASATGGETAEKSGEDVYTAACAACHMTGAAGAPKLEAAAWEARVAQGFDTLSNHAINGFVGANGNMPAKGGNAALSDNEVNKAVAYMVAQAGFESAVPAELLGGDQAAPEASADTQADTAAPEADVAEEANQESSESVDSTEAVTEVTEAEPTDAPVVAEADAAEENTSSVDAEAPAAEAETPAVAETAEASALLAADLTVGQSTYNKACMACHMTGAAGAPKLEAAAWETRVAQGHDVLIDHALNGFKVMPPKGGNPTLSDEEVIAATAFMLDQVGLLQ